MDKIKALLEKAGVKSELAAQICESLENYKNSIREQYDRDYAAKVEQAKKVCIEETEAHKRELARRVQIFCETKGAAIEAQIAKQSALNESEAVTKLTHIVGLLQGIKPNGRQSGEVTATIEKLKQKVKVANESRDRAVELANRKTAIAEKALKRNRELATAIKQIDEQRQATENAPAGRSIAESRRTAGNGVVGRIDGARNSGRARSTRATLTENQDRRLPQSTVRSAGYGIDNIAANMDGDIE
jgi:predicted nucleotidyltransferase